MFFQEVIHPPLSSGTKPRFASAMHRACPNLAQGGPMKEQSRARTTMCLLFSCPSDITEIMLRGILQHEAWLRLGLGRQSHHLLHDSLQTKRCVNTLVWPSARQTSLYQPTECAFSCLTTQGGGVIFKAHRIWALVLCGNACTPHKPGS